MGRSGRIVAGVAAGAAAWAVLWVGGTAASGSIWPDLVQPDVRLTHAGLLTAYIVYSVALSVLAGFLAAKVAGPAAGRAVGILAGIQLALGVFFEVSYWDLMPVWYHVVFLALIVPATLWGGRLGSR